MKAPSPTERGVQRAIISALRASGYRVVHIPNGGAYHGDIASRVRMAIAKRMDGEVAGFPDLLVMTHDGRSGFLEVKRPGGKAGEHQLACHALLAADGFPVAVVNDAAVALDLVRGWWPAKL